MVSGQWSVATNLARRTGRPDQDLEQVVGSEADFVTGESDNARVAGPEHLDLDAVAQPELLQSMNMVRLAIDSANPP